MKLNNYGWGLNQMLIYCGILLFFLVIAVFFIVQLSNSLGDAIKSSFSENITYQTVEQNIENATYSYMEKYYQEEIGTGTITVTAQNLIKYNILTEELLKPTEEKVSCNGYALVKKENDVLVVSPYINCNNYTTEGYQSWRLGE